MTTHSMFFYKGTSFPIENEKCNVMFNVKHITYDFAMKYAREMIANNLRKSESMEAQSNRYKKELDLINDALISFERKNGIGCFNKKNVEKICDTFGHSVEDIVCGWCLNICALLILKKIPNDELNGVLTFEVGSENVKIFEH
jgi:hypothetical protein